MISQGRVESIVHSKPRERRLLIEEAAGLGKHRKRRRRAELKLSRTHDNLDRALDVEREARSRLRPLKRQAQAAEIGARIEREALELRASWSPRSCASARIAWRPPRRPPPGAPVRDEIERRLAEVNARRRAAEERFADRDRERTVAWGQLTHLRGDAERIAVRDANLGDRAAELEARLERLRAELGPLTLDVDGAGAAPAQRARKLEQELGEVEAGLAAASEGSAAPGRRGPKPPGRLPSELSSPVPSVPRDMPAAPRACWGSATESGCGPKWPRRRS